MPNLSDQLDSQGRLRHLFMLEGLPASIYHELFARAESFVDPDTGGVRKTPLLRDKLVVNAFFEPSTRTRMSFEIAAKSLQAEVVNFDPESSSAAKGETLPDTLLTIAALGADAIVVRENEGGLIARHAPRLPAGVVLVNGGDGCHAHPSQGLLDAWTIVRQKGAVAGLSIAVIGDILHSRVARSLFQAFRTLGAARVVATGAPELVPAAEAERWGAVVERDVDQAVAGVDVIICLRYQYERMTSEDRSRSGGHESRFIIDAQRLALAAPDAIVLHPGPVNRDTEIASEVADGPSSRILEQVSNGVAMRMALLSMLLGR